MRKLSLLFSAVVVAISLLSAGQAFAVTLNSNADVDKNKKMVEYFYSHRMFEVMYRLGVEQDRKLGLQPDCKSRHYVHPMGLVVVSPIDFPENRRNPVKGVWMFRYSLTRCGDTKTYNAMFFADEATGGTPKAQAYFPGTSIANPLLIHDAMIPAITTALIKSDIKDVKDIKDVIVIDLRNDNLPHDVGEGDKLVKGLWNETWIFKVRGKQVNVPITFFKNPKNGMTTFFMDAK